MCATYFCIFNKKKQDERKIFSIETQRRCKNIKKNETF